MIYTRRGPLIEVVDRVPPGVCHLYGAGGTIECDRAAAGGATSPLTIWGSKVVYWSELADTATLLSGGSPVSNGTAFDNLTDKATAPHSASFAAGTHAKRLDNASHALTAGVWTGSESLLTTGTVPLSNADMEIWVAYKATTSFEDIVSATGLTAGPGGLAYGVPAAPTSRAIYIDDGSGSGNYNLWTAASVGAVGSWEYARIYGLLSSSNDTVTLEVNGVAFTPTPTFTTGLRRAHTSPFGSNSYRLGGTSTLNGILIGDFGEVVILNTASSGPEKTAGQSYFSRWL